MTTTPSTRWRKATASSANGCVELAPNGGDGGGGVLMRDSKLGDDSPVLRFTPEEWVTFVKGLHAGELHLA